MLSPPASRRTLDDGRLTGTAYPWSDHGLVLRPTAGPTHFQNRRMLTGIFAPSRHNIPAAGPCTNETVRRVGGGRSLLLSAE